MDRILLRDLTQRFSDFAQQRVLVKGWLRTVRNSKTFGFMELNDGSCFRGCQIVFEEEKLDKAIIRPKKERKAQSGVIVEGLDGCLVKFARCCNPLPGDEIVGFITRGFGVSIHKRDCINVVNSINDAEQKERWVRAEWAENVRDSVFKSALEIYAADRSDLLADVSIAIANMRIPLHSLSARETKDHHVMIQITLGITHLEQLNNIIGTFQRINGVISVERVNQ